MRKKHYVVHEPFCHVGLMASDWELGLYKNKEEGQLTLYTRTTSCYSMHVCSVSVLLFILGVAADVQNRPQNRAYFTVGIVFDICLVR